MHAEEKCVRRERTTWKIRGTKAKEENRRLRGEIKGSGSAKGENKMYEGEIAFEGEKSRITEENRRHNGEGETLQGHGEK